MSATYDIAFADQLLSKSDELRIQTIKQLREILTTSHNEGMTLDPSTRQEVEATLSKIHHDIVSFEKEFSSISTTLPSYTRRSLTLALGKMHKQIAAVRLKVIPKEVFRFQRLQSVYSSPTVQQSDHEFSSTKETNPTSAQELPEFAPLLIQAAESKDLIVERNQRPQDEITAHETAIPDIMNQTNCIIYAGDDVLSDAIPSTSSYPGQDIRWISEHISNYLTSPAVPDAIKVLTEKYISSVIGKECEKTQNIPISTSPFFKQILLHPSAGQTTPSTKPAIKSVTFRNQSPMAGKDIWFSDLSDCIVTILCPLVAVRLDKLSRCIIILGPVAGSVHIEDAKDCVIITACRQMRIHHAHNVFFSLHTESDPIVEHCSGAKFQPFTLGYPGLIKDVEDAGLRPLLYWDPTSLAIPPERDDIWGCSEPEEKHQKWACVRDFNWIRSRQSPNWSIVPRSERVRFLVPMKPTF